jgi:hypothetical protein
MTTEPEYKLDDTVTERDLLFRIARELTTLRKQTTEMISYLRDAESEVSEKMRRFIMYMHDIHDVMNMYTEQGHAVPAHVLREVERCDDRYRQLLEEAHSDGNTFEKVRRDMAQDPENRWDHTRALTFKGTTR